MAKTITIKTDRATFTLEFTRKTAALLEAQGFIAEELATKPHLRMPELFAGAFRAHHSRVKPDYIDKLWDSLPDKDKLIGKLAEMYAETVESLLADPEDDEGNVSWVVAE